MNLENEFIIKLKYLQSIDEIRIKLIDKGIPIIELEKQGYIINPYIDNEIYTKKFMNALYGVILK